MQIYQDELSTDLFSSFANWQICEMFSSLLSYLPMLELLSSSYCYLFVYLFYLFIFVFKDTLFTNSQTSRNAKWLV